MYSRHLFLYGRLNWQKKDSTCLETLLQKELNGDVARFTTHTKTVLQQISLYTCVVKRATSLFNSCCSNVAKQVASLLDSGKLPPTPPLNKHFAAS